MKHMMPGMPMKGMSKMAGDMKGMTNKKRKAKKPRKKGY